MVDNTQKVVVAISDLLIDIIDIAKGGIKIGSLPKIFDIVNDIKAIIESAPHAFPELTHLNSQDSAKLGEMSYTVIAKIIEHVKAITMMKHG